MTPRTELQQDSHYHDDAQAARHPVELLSGSLADEADVSGLTDIASNLVGEGADPGPIKRRNEPIASLPKSSTPRSSGEASPVVRPGL